MSEWIELIKVILFGIVEGITEWLPISSTGHMILLDEFIPLNVSDAFKEMFLVVIQLGAIMAVVILYFDKLNPLSRKKTDQERKATWLIWLKVVFGCLPAALLGLLLDDWLDEHLYNYVTVSIMLILYGLGFIIVEIRNKGKEAKISDLKDLTFQTALYIGLFQTLALIPGTSRSGATILGAILLGTSRYVATEFSFFLSIPIMFGASGLKLAKYFLEGHAFSQSEFVLLFIGMGVAFLVSMIAIRFLLRYLKHNDFKAFGWYRIALGLLVLGYFLFVGSF